MGICLSHQLVRRVQGCQEPAVWDLFQGGRSVVLIWKPVVGLPIYSLSFHRFDDYGALVDTPGHSWEMWACREGNC